jgi:Centromere DNA-binding protein complex CBF3 subunit, domain 2
MRQAANHSPRIRGFEIKHAVTPSAELLVMIWPELDAWKGRFGRGAGQINDLVGNGFCNLLFYLHEVILQDSVILIEVYPNYYLWSHPVFHYPAYKTWAASIRGSGADNISAAPSLSTRIQDALPDLAAELQQLHAQIKNDGERYKQEIKIMKLEVIDTKETIQYMASGGLAFRLEMTPRASLMVRGEMTTPAPTPVSYLTPPSSLSSSSISQNQSSLQQEYPLQQPSLPQTQIPSSPQESPSQESLPQQSLSPPSAATLYHEPSKQDC